MLLALACGSPSEPTTTEPEGTPAAEAPPSDEPVATPTVPSAGPEEKFGAPVMEDPSTHRSLEPDADQSRSGEIDILQAKELLESGQVDEAQAILRVAIEVRPEDSDAHYWLGRSLQLQGAHDPAADAMLRATELDPDFASAWEGVGFNYTIQRRCAEALPAQTRYIELRPEDSGGYYNRAGCRWYTTDREGSLEDGRKACEMGHQVACAHVEKQLGRQEMLEAFEARRAADLAEKSP
jgi:tetratricopeptide (TPR) repeat protein